MPGGLKISLLMIVSSGGSRSCVGGITEYSIDQCRVAILGELLQLAALEPDHVAICVVVGLAVAGRIVAAPLDHDEIVLRDVADRGVSQRSAHLCPQRREQFGKHGGLAVI